MKEADTNGTERKAETDFEGTIRNRERCRNYKRGKGKIYLRKRQEQTSMPILSLDSNIQSYDMSRSIYKTRTRLTLVTSKNAKKGSFVNSSLEKKIGKFADIQTVDEDVTKTELNQKISTFKKDTSFVDQELSVTASLSDQSVIVPSGKQPLQAGDKWYLLAVNRNKIYYFLDKI